VLFRTQKSALRDGLIVTGKNSLMLFTVTSDLSKRLCINLLLKFILQSKALLLRVLQYNTQPNNAFGCQTLPHNK